MNNCDFFNFGFAEWIMKPALPEGSNKVPNTLVKRLEPIFDIDGIKSYYQSIYSANVNFYGKTPKEACAIVTLLAEQEIINFNNYVADNNYVRDGDLFVPPLVGDFSGFPSYVAGLHQWGSAKLIGLGISNPAGLQFGIGYSEPINYWYNLPPITQYNLGSFAIGSGSGMMRSFELYNFDGNNFTNEDLRGTHISKPLFRALSVNEEAFLAYVLPTDCSIPEPIPQPKYSPPMGRYINFENQPLDPVESNTTQCIENTPVWFANHARLMNPTTIARK